MTEEELNMNIARHIYSLSVYDSLMFLARNVATFFVLIRKLNSSVEKEELFSKFIETVEELIEKGESSKKELMQ